MRHGPGGALAPRVWPVLALLFACGGSDGPNGNQPDAIQLTPDAAEMELDSAVTLTAAGEADPVRWSADDEAVVQLKDFGENRVEVRGRSLGATTIRASSADEQRSGSAAVRVLPDMLISPPSADVSLTQTVKLTVVDAAGPVTWSSSDESVASVSPTGLVTGLDPGSTAIMASSGAQRAIAPLNVLCDPVGPFGRRTTEQLTFLRLPAGGPVPETTDTSIYALENEPRELVIHFRNPDGSTGAEYLSLRFGFIGRVNGVPLGSGDSVLMRLRIPDPHQVRFELLPLEVYPPGGFDSFASLTIDYASTDYPRVEPVGAHNRCLLETFGEWLKDEDADSWERIEFASVGLATARLQGPLYHSGEFGMAYHPPDF